MSFSKKVAFHTLGCKVNQYETESIKNQLIKRGYEEVPFEDKSDIYIINSCTVTSIADRKTRNMLRRAKKINPELFEERLVAFLEKEYVYFHLGRHNFLYVFSAKSLYLSEC